MSLAIILAAGESSRLQRKQLLIPTGTTRPLIAQAVAAGRKLADRVVVVASSALYVELPALGCLVLDVGLTPATSVDSALAARWHALGDREPIIVLDSDAVYDDAHFNRAIVGDFIGVAFAPYTTSELSAVTAVTRDYSRLAPKNLRQRGELVGAGVYGFAGFSSLRARAEDAPERSMAGLFTYRGAEKFYIYNWNPYGTEEQRAKYEASRVHAGAPQHLPGAPSGAATPVDD
jgi:choline kinase